jgi:PKD repeat protein
MVKVTFEVDDAACYVVINGVTHYITSTLPSVPVGTDIYPYVAVSIGGAADPVGGLQCIYGCTSDPWKSAFYDTHASGFWNTSDVRYSDQARSSVSGIGLPKITMTAAGVSGKFIVMDVNNNTLAEGRLFEILPAAEGRTINICDPYYGRFTIDSNPSGALVYIDSVPTNHYTPTDECMSVGTRTIRLTKSGYLDKSTTWTVTQGHASVDEKFPLFWSLDLAPVCAESETRCDGYTQQQCRNNAWANIETNSVHCNYIPVVSDPCTLCSAGCTDYVRCPGLKPDPCATCAPQCVDYTRCPGLKPVVPTTKPIAKITPSAITGTSPLTVTFKESNVVSGITSGLLTFGDGTSISLLAGSTTHTYTAPGTYAVAYKVTNSIGSDTAVTSIKVDAQTSGGVGTGGGGTGGGTGGGGGAATQCEGLNRNGSLDPTCILETGNELYLYGAIGVIALIVLMRKK